MPAAFLVVILLVRPLAVMAATIGSGLKRPERIFLSAMAPRGIVAAAISSVFALRLREANIPDADKLVPLVFVIIVGTVVIYGLTAAKLGRWLGVATPNAQGCLIIGAHSVACAIGIALQQTGNPVLIVDTSRSAIAQARLQGLPTFHGNIIGPHVEDKLDLSGIGRMLAIAPNDEVNSLACVQFAKVFGRSEIYQLATSHAATDSRSSRIRTEMSEYLRGRTLFSFTCTLSELQARQDAGTSIRKTTLTELFDMSSFRKAHPEAITMFLLGVDGDLTVVTDDLNSANLPGQTVINWE